MVCPPVTLEWSFCSAKGVAATALHLNGKWAQDKNTGAWPELIWILMAIWLAGHAKQGGSTFIRGTDPTTLRRHTVVYPGCCHGSRLLWRLIIHQRFELWCTYWFLDDLVCILFVKTIYNSRAQKQKLIAENILAEYEQWSLFLEMLPLVDIM